MIAHETREALAMIALVAIAATAVTLVHCAPGWDDVDPRSTRSTVDYPCGVAGLVCRDKTGHPNGYCCSEGDTCGSGPEDVGCPVDACCDVRTPPRPLRRLEDAGPSPDVVTVVRLRTRAQ